MKILLALLLTGSMAVAGTYADIEQQIQENQWKYIRNQSRPVDPETLAILLPDRNTQALNRIEQAIEDLHRSQVNQRLYPDNPETW